MSRPVCHEDVVRKYLTDGASALIVAAAASPITSEVLRRAINATEAAIVMVQIHIREGNDAWRSKTSK